MSLCETREFSRDHGSPSRPVLCVRPDLDDDTLMEDSEEEQKSLLMKEKSEKVDLKLNIQKAS